MSAVEDLVRDLEAEREVERLLTGAEMEQGPAALAVGLIGC